MRLNILYAQLWLQALSPPSYTLTVRAVTVWIISNHSDKTTDSHGMLFTKTTFNYNVLFGFAEVYCHKHSITPFRSRAAVCVQRVSEGERAADCWC